MENKYKLLIETNDEKGLVYKVAKVLFQNDINIEQNSEYVDKQCNAFFNRSIISGNIDKNALLTQIEEILPKNSKVRLCEYKNKDIVILATKESHCIGDILINHTSGELDADIKAVISNQIVLKELVEKFDIPFIYITHDGISRQEHESKIIKAIDKYNPELIVLAKYMRILNDEFVSRYQHKLLNIHHSFLPAFIGANPYKQAYSRGVKIIGATAHYVTKELDEGPIISQDITRVDHTYSWQDMARAGKDIEKVVLSKAINLVLDDKVFIYSNKTVIL